MLLICTSHISYTGPDKLDISASADTIEGKLFVPIRPDTEAGASDEAVQEYYQLMRERYAANEPIFVEMVRRGAVVFACTCALPDNCHRRLAADILDKIAERHGIITLMGHEIK